MTASTHTEPAPASITARVLAPVAIAAVVCALVAVTAATLAGSGGGSGGESRRPAAGASAERTHVVQPGETLSELAAENGVSVERILKLNPEVDPQALPAGVELELRR